MRKDFLVIQTVRDCKHQPDSYVVLAKVELDERVVRGLDSVMVPEQVAQALRELLARHTKPER